MNYDSLTLTSTEVSIIQLSYLNDSMSKCTLAYFYKVLESNRHIVKFVSNVALMDKGEPMKNKTKGDNYGN